MMNYVLTIGIVLLSVTTGAFYWYYEDSQETLRELAETNTQYKLALEDNQRALERIEDEFDEAIVNINEAIRRAEEAEKYQDQLLSKLRRHDLTRLTYAKPNLIEKRVNDATAEIFDELEQNTATTQPE